MRRVTRRRSSEKPLIAAEARNRSIDGDEVDVRVADVERLSDELRRPRLLEEPLRRARRLPAANDEVRAENPRFEAMLPRREAERDLHALREVVRVAGVEDPDAAAERRRPPEDLEREIRVRSWNDGLREPGAVALPGAEVDGLVSEEHVVGTRVGGEPRRRRVASLASRRRLALVERGRLVPAPRDLGGEQQAGQGDEDGQPSSGRLD